MFSSEAKAFRRSGEYGIEACSVYLKPLDDNKASASRSGMIRGADHEAGGFSAAGASSV